MASTGRDISPRDFSVLIADLRLTSTIFQERFVRISGATPDGCARRPRIRWPTTIVIEARLAVRNAAARAG
jgi:hypothetical protein